MTERDLAVYYDKEAADRAGRGLDSDRVRVREGFIRSLPAPGQLRLLEIGTGPGHDAAALFSRRSDARWLELLQLVGPVTSFETWSDPADGWWYQWATIVRAD